MYLNKVLLLPTGDHVQLHAAVPILSHIHKSLLFSIQILPFSESFLFISKQSRGLFQRRCCLRISELPSTGAKPQVMLNM